MSSETSIKKIKVPSEPLSLTACPELISNALLLKIIGCSDMTARRWVKRKVLPPPAHINGRRYWKRAAIQEWFDAQQPTEVPSGK